MTDPVLWARTADGVVTLTLNRPGARNALNTAMAEALLAGTRRAVAEEARLILVRANGPVFCAGADLKERKGMDEDPGPRPPPPSARRKRCGARWARRNACRASSASVWPRT